MRIEICSKKNNEIYEFKKDIVNCIKNGIPILLMVNQKILDYHPQYVLSMNEMKHGVLLFGYESQEESVLLADSFVLDKNGIVKAVISRHNILDIYNNTDGYMWIENCNKKVVNTNDTINAIIRSYTRFQEKNKNTNQYLFGKYAIEKCITDLYYQVDWSDNQHFDFIKFAHLIRLRYNIQFEYQSRILNIIKERKGIEDINLYNTCKILEDSWNKYIIKLLKLMYFPTEEMFYRIERDGLKLIEQQVAVQNEMSDFLLHVLSTI